MQEKEKTVYVIGIGPGKHSSLTLEAVSAMVSSECAIGAKRLLDSLSGLLFGKEKKVLIKAPEIVEYLSSCPYETVSVILSGDLGFYSGGKNLLPLLQQENFKVKPICGISSLVYFCGKLATPWDDVEVVSLHGREGSVLGAVMNNKKVFFLTGSNMSVTHICRILKEKGCGSLRVSVGEKLSYAEERIVLGTAEELSKMVFDNLSVMLVENTQPLSECAGNYGFTDSIFQRGNVPMTKEEVRAVSLSKLRIGIHAIAYDIGAGTGSVAAEMACRARKGTVFAIEKNPEAKKVLEENKLQLGLFNMEILAGAAPDALTDLPPADCVFIGGSSGKMEEILKIVLEKNSKVHVVVNAITLETLTQTVSLFETLGFIDVDICQISVSKAKHVGSYHMMTGQNPVYIISGTGKGIEDHGEF